eukprot:m.56628 g.56628  ORF g.56628 m.56628 type:complete len:434 (+) comp7692_c0_seq1:205-1506(+)
MMRRMASQCARVVVCLLACAALVRVNAADADGEVVGDDDRGKKTAALLDETSKLVDKLEETMTGSGGASCGRSATLDATTIIPLRRPTDVTASVHRSIDALELRVAQLLQVAAGETVPDIGLPLSAPTVACPKCATGCSHQATGDKNANATSAVEEDVEAEIVKQCAVPRAGLRIGIISVVLLLVGAPLLYVFYNRRSIIDGIVDKEFEVLDVNNSNSIDANEFYIAVLQMYLKVNRITTILPPKYRDIRRYFADDREMDREEFKTAVAVLIDTTLKRVVASLALALATPWIAPYIVDAVALAVIPLVYVADTSSCGQAVVIVVGNLMNRQLFTTITSVVLVLIALPRIFMWIDQEEQQILEGAEGAENLSIMGRIKMFLAAPKLVQTRITQAPGNIAGNLLAATKRLSEKVDEVRLRNRVVGALNDSDEEDE